MEPFRDRRHAGRELGERVVIRARSARWDDPVVLGLARGGVPVAAEVAAALEAPLGALVVRKLGAPHQPELALGAVGELVGSSEEPGVVVWNEELVEASGLGLNELRRLEALGRDEASARVRRLRSGRPPNDLVGRTAVLVDDGVATGATARAAAELARKLGAATVVLAVPVAAEEALAELTGYDEVVCLATPSPFIAVGLYYTDFTQTSDEEVAALLRDASA